MPGAFHHEELYRGAAVSEILAAASVTLCGGGALGSNLADTLARQGFRRLRVIDRDRVEAHNLGTQTYTEADIGAWKADVLRNQLFRAVGVEIEAFHKELTDRSAVQLLRDSKLVVDLFDNMLGRELVQRTCRTLQIPCLHAGLFADYGEVLWDADYRVPRNTEGDVCDYPLARNLALLTAVVTSEVILRWLVQGVQENYTITLRDLAIRAAER